MKTKVYKVVYNNDGVLESSFMAWHGKANGLCRNYAVGITTVPYAGTKLFAFKDLAEALDYASYVEDSRVFEAEAENATSMGMFDFALTPEEAVKAFAENTLARNAVWMQSTVVCDSITLTREIPKQNS